MKSVINPETGELVWEAETKAEKAQAEKANKAASAAPLEALAEAFGETEAETEFYIFVEGEAYPCTEETVLLADTELTVKVTGNSESALTIEALNWYDDFGVCRLTVNYFSVAAALRIFAETVEAFNKSEGAGLLT